MLSKAFPNWHETLEDIIAEGDKVCVRLKIDTGTHMGEFNLLGLKVSPTGKKSTAKSIQIWRIVEGKVVEQESVADELGLMIKMGAKLFVVIPASIILGAISKKNYLALGDL